MTIRRGENWGSAVESPAGLTVVRDGAELGRYVIERRLQGTKVERVGIASGDMARTMGGGTPGRFDGEVLKYAGAAEQDAGRFVRTMKAADLLSQDLYACGAKDADTTCLVWGDSHAMCLLTGLEALADRYESGVQTFGRSQHPC